MKHGRTAILAAISFAFLALPAMGADLVPTELPANCQWQSALPSSPEALICRSKGSDVDVSYTGFHRQSWVAAQKGEAAGVRDLGRLYAFGPASVRDPARAQSLLMAAATMGDLLAMFELGQINHDGVGVPIDMQKAAFWYRKGAEGGDSESAYELGELELNGAAATQDLPAAIQHFQSAAAKGNANALRALGWLTLRGQGVKADQDEAVRLFERAAALGEPSSMQSLAYIYANGLGVPRDVGASQKWSREAAQINNKVKMPDIASRANVFPIEAAVAGVSGKAFYHCRIVADGWIEDCRVVSELPAGFGFGEAGLQLLSKIERSPEFPVGSEITLPIAFVAPRDLARDRMVADQCASEGLALSRLGPLSSGGDWILRYWTALSSKTAEEAGIADTPERLAPAVEAATDRLEKGGDRNWLGLVNRCSLK